MPELPILKPTAENCDQCRLPPRDDLATGRLIVCEPSGRWAVALRRELSACAGLSIEQTRSVAACWQRLHDAPAAFVVVELTRGNLDTWLDCMTKLEWRYPLARVAVVVRRDPLDNGCLSRYQWLAREAGAVFVGTSVRSEALPGDGPSGIRQLADVVRRHMQRSPLPQKSVSQEIWDNLPWKS